MGSLWVKGLVGEIVVQKLGFGFVDQEVYVFGAPKLIRFKNFYLLFEMQD